MSATIGDTLPFAIAVALSPLPIIAVILILLSRQPRRNGAAFLFGWIVGLAVAEGIVLAVVGLLDLSPGGGPTTPVALFKLLLGLLLIYFGIAQWRKRAGKEHQPSMPRWMASIDAFTPAKAFGLALLLSSAGNLALILAAAAAIARAKLGVGQEVGALATFIIFGSVTVAATVIYHVAAGEKASKMLLGLKEWLLANNSTITIVMLLLVGGILVGKGFSGLDLFG